MKKIKDASIHIRVDKETQNKWRRICRIYKGNTQSRVFRQLVNLLHESIEQPFNIRNYEK